MQSLRLYNLFIWLGLTVIFSISCADKQAEKKITGGADAEILNLQDSTIHIYSDVFPLDFIKGKAPSFNEYIEVDSNGIFMYPYKFNEGYYFVEWDRNRVKYFIREGKRLSLDFDAKKPTDKPEFSGKLKYESRYLFDKHLVLAKFESNLPFHYSLSESEFLDVLNLLRSKLDKMLVLYITNRPVGSEYFMKQESLSNLYYTASIIEKYKLEHLKINPNDVISDTLNNVTNHLSLNDSNAIENTDYFNFLNSRIWAITGYPTSKNKVYNQMNLLDSVVVRDDYKNYVLFSTTLEVAKWEKSEDRNKLIDTLLFSISDSEVKKFLIQNVNQDTISLMINDSLNNTQE